MLLYLIRRYPTLVTSSMLKSVCADKTDIIMFTAITRLIIRTADKQFCGVVSQHFGLSARFGGELRISQHLALVRDSVVN